MSPEILAEAAVWLARLHGPDRAQSMERDCLAWQARSAAHRLAFERCTDTWQDVAGVQRQQIHASPPAHRRRSANGAWKVWRQALVLAAAGSAAAFALRFWPVGAYSTDVGEQRLIVLADGSRMTLNTATAVRVKMTDTQRTVTVEHGEALFEVAKDASRPFVVSASDAKVVATGTAFLVRSLPAANSVGDAFDVALLEGQVIVQRSGKAFQSALTGTVVMRPGERLRVGQAISGSGRRTSAPVRLDSPKLDELLAWTRGVAVLDNVALGDAVDDMNRYSNVPIRVAESQGLKDLRISGSFRTGDNEAFARAVAKVHGLVVQPHDGELLLTLK